MGKRIEIPVRLVIDLEDEDFQHWALEIPHDFQRTSGWVTDSEVDHLLRGESKEQLVEGFSKLLDDPNLLNPVDWVESHYDKQFYEIINQYLKNEIAIEESNLRLHRRESEHFGLVRCYDLFLKLEDVF